VTDVRPLRLAHRGDWRGATENSLAAFRAALALDQCDGSELDVRSSADGVPVVIHDPSLARVQGIDRRVDAMEAGALAALGVPSVAQLLAMIPPHAFLDIELKEDVARAVVPLVAAGRGDPPEQTVISSFQAGIIATVRALRPAWPCWLNTTSLGPGSIDLAVALGCTGVAALWRAIDERAVSRARNEGLTVAAWTVRSRSTARRLAGLGVDVLIVEGAALEP
jgi:glycerophosphoryl diester phosphodiesterase